MRTASLVRPGAEFAPARRAVQADAVVTPLDRKAPAQSPTWGDDPRRREAARKPRDRLSLKWLGTLDLSPGVVISLWPDFRRRRMAGLQVSTEDSFPAALRSAQNRFRRPSRTAYQRTIRLSELRKSRSGFSIFGSHAA